MNKDKTSSKSTTKTSKAKEPKVKAKVAKSSASKDTGKVAKVKAKTAAPKVAKVKAPAKKPAKIAAEKPKKTKPAKAVAEKKVTPKKKPKIAKVISRVKARARVVKSKVKAKVKAKTASKSVAKAAPKVKTKTKSATKAKINKEQELPLLSLMKSQIIEDIPQITGKPPVILQILPELKLGGVERGTIEIAKAGKKLGYEMLVASEGGHLVNQLDSATIKHIKLPLASKSPFVIFENIRSIRKAIKDNDVDIVHARSRAPAWSAYFAAKKEKCHFITTFHGTYSLVGPFKRLYNSIMTKGEVVIAISEFIKDHIVENYNLDVGKIRVVPRGVDLEQFTRDKIQKIRIINMAELFKIELDVPIILLPGRFTRWKGQGFLLDALELIKNEKFVCIFAGYDKKQESYYRDLESKVKEYGLFQKVRIIGVVKDMPALYSLSDIVVSASTLPEAFGRIAIEGQAMERMVVATNHGGSCETVRNGENGWLVDSDDVEGLANILKELLNIDAKRRESVTKNARKNVERNFSMDNMVKRTFAVYNEVLGRKIV
jgi:glycosyltransferase involved in cell wall biosynthesis